jgi:hypothetical protein
MNRLFAVLVLLLMIAGSGCARRQPALTVLANASFEQPLDSGWVQTVVNDSTPLDSGTIERSDTLGQPGGGFAARVYKYHKQYSSLSQTVALDADFHAVHFWARFRLGADVPCAPVAAVVLSYLDGAGNRLARTVIGRFSSYSTWADSDSEHLVKVADTTGAWAPYTLVLAAELDSFLPHVPRERIKQLRVELYAYVDYSG